MARRRQPTGFELAGHAINLIPGIGPIDPNRIPFAQEGRLSSEYRFLVAVFVTEGVGGPGRWASVEVLADDALSAEEVKDLGRLNAQGLGSDTVPSGRSRGSYVDSDSPAQIVWAARRAD